MIDYTSIESFVGSLPDVSSDIQKTLFLRLYAPDAFAPGCALAASRGYLGCLPFAAVGKDQIAARLFPGRLLESCPIIIAWGGVDVTDGLTITSRVNNFVTGRLLQMDRGAPENVGMLSENVRRHLIALATEFGDVISCENVLESIVSGLPEDLRERNALLYGKADPKDPLFTILSVAESDMPIEEKMAWVVDTVKTRKDVDILWRMFASIGREDESFDVSEAAWELIQRDDVYDCTYEVGRPGTAMGLWKNKPLMVALRWLKSKKLTEIPIDSDLWAAAQAYEAKGNKYDGELHLAYARRIAEQNPLQAYTHTANAVAYQYRAKHKTSIEAIEFAYELAKTNHWIHLEIVLDWTLQELRAAKKKTSSGKSK